MCSKQARKATGACRFEGASAARDSSSEFIIQMEAKPGRPIRDESG